MCVNIDWQSNQIVLYKYSAPPTLSTTMAVVQNREGLTGAVVCRCVWFGQYPSEQRTGHSRADSCSPLACSDQPNDL